MGKFALKEASGMNWVSIYGERQHERRDWVFHRAALNLFSVRIRIEPKLSIMGSIQKSDAFEMAGLALHELKRWYLDDP